jgi:hypothetical protein
MPLPVEPDIPTDTEPVAVAVGSLAVLVDAGIITATALDLIDLTGEQAAAVVAFVTVASASFGAWLRQLVFCRRTVRAAGVNA